MGLSAPFLSVLGLACPEAMKVYTLHLGGTIDLIYYLAMGWVLINFIEMHFPYDKVPVWFWRMGKTVSILFLKKTLSPSSKSINRTNCFNFSIAAWSLAVQGQHQMPGV